MRPILDGRSVGGMLRDELGAAVQHLQRDRGLTPQLAVVQVGEDVASAWYARAINRVSAGRDRVRAHALAC